jgi:IstB-like ATP binding protein
MTSTRLAPLPNHPGRNSSDLSPVQSKADRSHLKTLTRLAKVQPLILDDLFLSPLSDPERKDLLEIIEDRHALASTVITSQCPVKDWHHAIGEPTLADALLVFPGGERLSTTANVCRKAVCKIPVLIIPQP